MSLKKNLLKNGLASAIQKVIKITEQLLLVPFFISAWGAAYYGEWLTLTIIPTVLGFSDMGFGSAAANKFILRYTSGDKDGAANTAKSGLLIISIAVLFSILLSMIIIYLADRYNLFNKSLIKRYDAILAVSFLMIAKILCFYQQMFEAFFRAERKAALSINLMNIYGILAIVVSLIVLVFHKGVIFYALSYLSITIFFNLVYSGIATRILKVNVLKEGKVYLKEIKDIAKNGIGYLLSIIWQSIYFQGTTFVVRIALGPIAVTIFNTVRTLSRSVNQLIILISAATYPELQYEIGANNLNKARKIFRISLLTTFSVSIIGIFFLLIFGLDFYKIWTHKSLVVPFNMWIVFLVSILFNSLWWVSINIFHAYNKPYKYTIAGFFCAILSVASSYFLSTFLGLFGAAIGSFLLDFLLTFYVLPNGLKQIGQSYKTIFSDIFEDLNSFKISKKLFRYENTH
jgi:O-antigen/teichoic acid export membrane protein